MKNKALIFSIVIASASNAFAVAGIGDLVIVAANPAQELLWAAKELPQWLDMIDKAKQQVNRAQEAIDIMGHPEKLAGKLMGMSLPVLSATKAANAIKSSTELIDFTEKSWTLFKGAGQELAHALNVDPTFEVFGQTVARDTKRYLTLAKEKALRGRLEDILKKKQLVDGQELEFQEMTLAALRTAKTQTELALHQAGLAASKQRMDILASRVTQAEAELHAFVADVELETRKDTERVQEKTEATIDEMRIQANAAVQRIGASL